MSTVIRPATPPEETRSRVAAMAIGWAVVVAITLLVVLNSNSGGGEPEVAVLGVTLTAAPLEPVSSGVVDTSLCTRVDGPTCEFDYDNFDSPTVIDNPWLPMTPGTRLVYEGTTNEDNELLDHQVVITVTDLIKVIDGIETVVSWDLDYSEGELVEAELAFFAQDNDGNVWRMGEHPEEYEDGILVDAPTWLAGINGAEAGISMLGDPRVGTLSYSQGWGPDVEFIDRAQIAEIGTDTCVATGCYAAVLVVDEFNTEEPNARQLKYFAPGVGNIMVRWAGDDETQEELELVSVEVLKPGAFLDVKAAALELEASAYEISPDVYGRTDPAKERQ
jgi:hypothetical protein